MNCRQLAKVLPEMVAGELDERTAREAREHTEKCPACAAERAAYEEVLGAAAGSWEVMKAPDDLVLEIPERRALPLGRLGLAAAALAMIAVIVTTLPGSKKHQTRDIELAKKTLPVGKPSVVRSVPEKREVAAVPAPSSGPERRAPSVHAPSTAPAACYQIAEPGKKTYRRHRQGFQRPTPRSMALAPNPEEKARPESTEQEPVAERPVTAMIVASVVPPPAGPPSIEMQSVDEATGQVTVQSISFDGSGKKQESEVTYVPNVTDSWRDNL